MPEGAEYSEHVDTISALSTIVVVDKE